jgi:hypothetical protein
VVKDLFKHWRAAHVALGLKSWPEGLKGVVRPTYIDRFYEREIASELERMRP